MTNINTSEAIVKADSDSAILTQWLLLSVQASSAIVAPWIIALIILPGLASGGVSAEGFKAVVNSGSASLTPWIISSNNFPGQASGQGSAEGLPTVNSGSASLTPWIISPNSFPGQASGQGSAEGLSVVKAGTARLIPKIINQSLGQRRENVLRALSSVIPSFLVSSTVITPENISKVVPFGRDSFVRYWSETHSIVRNFIVDSPQIGYVGQDILHYSKWLEALSIMSHIVSADVTVSEIISSVARAVLFGYSPFNYCIIASYWSTYSPATVSEPNVSDVYNRRVLGEIPLVKITDELNFLRLLLCGSFDTEENLDGTEWLYARQDQNITKKIREILSLDEFSNSFTIEFLYGERGLSEYSIKRTKKCIYKNNCQVNEQLNQNLDEKNITFKQLFEQYERTIKNIDALVQKVSNKTTDKASVIKASLLEPEEIGNKFLNLMQDVFTDKITKTEGIRQLTEMFYNILLQKEVNGWMEEHNEVLSDGHKRYIFGGYTSHTYNTMHGVININIPKTKDQSDNKIKITFHSKIIKSYERTCEELNNFMSILYLNGISGSKISVIMKDSFGSNTRGLEKSTVYNVVGGKFTEDAREFNERDLSSKKYRFLFIDASYFKGKIFAKGGKMCLMAVIGIDENFNKVLISLEHANFESKEEWLRLFDRLEGQGLMLEETGSGIIADGGTGLWAAVSEKYPEVSQMQCWVHKFRNIYGLISKKDKRCIEIMDDAKKICYAGSYDEGMNEFKSFKEKYGKSHPKVVESIEESLDRLLEFLKYPEEIHVKIRTSNAIESLFASIKLRTKKTRGNLSMQNLFDIATMVAINTSYNFKNWFSGEPEVKSEKREMTESGSKIEDKENINKLIQVAA
jgi:transposase-like protein